MRTDLATWLAILFGLYMWISQYVGKGVSTIMADLFSQSVAETFALVMYWLVVVGMFVILGTLVYRLACKIRKRLQESCKRGTHGELEQQDNQALEKPKGIRIDSKDFSSTDFSKMNSKQIAAFFEGLTKLKQNDNDTKGGSPDMSETSEYLRLHKAVSEAWVGYQQKFDALKRFDDSMRYPNIISDIERTLQEREVLVNEEQIAYRKRKAAEKDYKEYLKRLLTDFQHKP